jgi:hypothetical protein
VSGTTALYELPQYGQYLPTGEDVLFFIVSTPNANASSFPAVEEGLVAFTGKNDAFDYQPFALPQACLIIAHRL